MHGCGLDSECLLHIRGDLAGELRAWRRERREPAGKVRAFRLPTELVKILNRDLASAGIANRDDADRPARSVP